MRTNFRPSARAMLWPRLVLPTPGGPTKHRIGSRAGVSPVTRGRSAGTLDSAGPLGPAGIVDPAGSVGLAETDCPAGTDDSASAEGSPLPSPRSCRSFLTARY